VRVPEADFGGAWWGDGDLSTGMQDTPFWGSEKAFTRLDLAGNGLR